MIKNVAYDAYMKADIRKIRKRPELFGKMFLLGYEGKPLPKHIHKTDLIYGAYQAGRERGKS